jgi:hypothetical protein
MFNQYNYGFSEQRYDYDALNEILAEMLAAAGASADPASELYDEQLVKAYSDDINDALVNRGDRIYYRGRLAVSIRL